MIAYSHMTGSFNDYLYINIKQLENRQQVVNDNCSENGAQKSSHLIKYPYIQHDGHLDLG